MLVGCTGKQEDRNANADSNVVAVVNGQMLYRDTARDSALVIAKILEMSGHKVDEKSFGKWLDKTSTKICSNLVNAMLVDSMLDKTGIAPTEESDAKALQRYSKLVGRDFKDADELCHEFTGLEDFFAKQFKQESRFIAYMASNDVYMVSREEIETFFKNATNMLVRCQRINRRAYAVANEAWRMLADGEEWSAVAPKFSEDELIEPSYVDNWQHWMSIKLSDIDSNELIAALKNMKSGDFTKPIMLDDGLAIVHVDDIDNELYVLSRILVRAAIDYSIPSYEKALEEICNRKENDFQKQLIEKLRSDAKVNIYVPFNEPQHKRETQKTAAQERS